MLKIHKAHWLKERVFERKLCQLGMTIGPKPNGYRKNYPQWLGVLPLNGDGDG